MLTSLADPRALARDVLRDVYTPKDRLGVADWCEAHVRITEKGTGAARPGPWDTSLTPCWRQVFGDLTDPRVRRISVKKSSQVGYSQLMLGYIMYIAGELRQPAAIVFPTEDSAIRFNERRLIPTLRECPATMDLVATDRDIKQTEIKVGGIPIYFGWAHSTRTVKSDPCAIGIADEIDEYPAGGKTLSNLLDRQRNFDDRTLLEGSTPEDDEAEGYISWQYANAGHRHRFVVPCPITGEFFELYDFGLLQWHGGRDADPDGAGRHCWLQSPHVAVPKHRVGEVSDGRIDERHKAWMARHGIWVRQGEEIETTDEWLEYVQSESPGPVPDLSTVDADFLREPARGGRYSRLLAAKEPDAATRRAMGLVRIVGGEDGAAGRIPPASHVSYRINALSSLLDAGGWGGIVTGGLRARLGPDWQKGTLGQAPSIKGDIASVRHLRDRCTPTDEGGYQRGTVPDGIGLVSAGVDVQKDCLYALAIGFGAPETDPAIIDAVRIERDERAGLRDVDDELAAWRFAIGNTSVRPVFLGVDCGYWMGDVHALVERLRSRGVLAWNARGYAGRQARSLIDLKRVPEKDERGNETGRTHETLYFHTDLWMNQLYGLLSDGPEAGQSAGGGSGFGGPGFGGPGSGGPAAIETMLGEPRRMRLPAPFAFDRGRVSGSTADLLAQITAERRVTAYSGNIPVQRWVLKREGLDNHLGDCARIAMAGAQFRGADMLDAEAIERLRIKATRNTGGEAKESQQLARPAATPPRQSRPRHAPAHSPGAIAQRYFGR